MRELSNDKSSPDESSLDKKRGHSINVVFIVKEKIFHVTISTFVLDDPLDPDTLCRQYSYSVDNADNCSQQQKKLNTEDDKLSFERLHDVKIRHLLCYFLVAEHQGSIVDSSPKINDMPYNIKKPHQHDQD